MSLSQKNANVGKYIADHSSMSPVLVTGLCGLYSSLPNSIEILTVDWFRITADDVNEIPSLTLFMNSLEFCNAVVQVVRIFQVEQRTSREMETVCPPLFKRKIQNLFQRKYFQFDSS